MRSEEDIRKAYALAADASEELEEKQPAEAAGAFIMLKGLAWVLEEPEGDGLFEDMNEEFQELLEEVGDGD